ncbi:hypothetical protein JW887_03295 [Candidatus Dojkabacteria bacterium]|nr:hypothetical protein [Candidatus Dojkabacteria bacterium]
MGEKRVRNYHCYKRNISKVDRFTIWDCVRLAKLLNKEITIYGDSSTIPDSIRNSGFFGGIHRWGSDELAIIILVTQFWVTFIRSKTSEKVSEPLNKLTLSFDDKNDRLKIIISY